MCERFVAAAVAHMNYRPRQRGCRDDGVEATLGWWLLPSAVQKASCGSRIC